MEPNINVPFPEDSQSIIDTITQALLLNPDRHIEKKRVGKNQIEFDFGQFDEATTARANVTRKLEEAAEREKVSRGIFAQNAIKAQETLPENDRVRYTISPAARKEVLKRLLAENHRRAAAQALAADAATPAKKKRGKKSASDDANGELFL